MTQRVPEAIRRLVRERAHDRCEYCGKPSNSAFYSHHIDHIIPPLHGGSGDLNNLAWACFQCNTTKSDNIASYDELTGLLTPLYHPRRDKWNEHFFFDGATIHTRTAIGRVTIRVLQMNHPDQLAMRGYLMDGDEW